MREDRAAIQHFYSPNIQLAYIHIHIHTSLSLVCHFGSEVQAQELCSSQTVERRSYIGACWQSMTRQHSWHNCGYIVLLLLLLLALLWLSIANNSLLFPYLLEFLIQCCCCRFARSYVFTYPFISKCIKCFVANFRKCRSKAVKLFYFSRHINKNIFELTSNDGNKRFAKISKTAIGEL